MPPAKESPESPSETLEKYRNAPEQVSSQLNKENSLLRSRYLHLLQQPDDYSDLTFSPAEAQFIRKKLSHLSTGAYAAIPLICPGTELCPFSHSCPFAQVGKTPVNRPCLVETNLLQEWIISFIYEYDIHPESMTDRFYVQEMAEIELLLYRINTNLSKLQYGELVADSVANVTPQGRVIYEEKVVPLMDLKLRLQQRRDKVIAAMVGDRQGKWKKQAALKLADGGDAASQGSNLRQNLERLQRQLGTIAAKVAAQQEESPEEEKVSFVQDPNKGKVIEGKFLEELVAEELVTHEEESEAIREQVRQTELEQINQEEEEKEKEESDILDEYIDAVARGEDLFPDED